MRLKFILLLLAISFCYSYGQNIIPENNDVNVKSYVDKQIKEAKTKNDAKKSQTLTVKKNKIEPSFSLSAFLIDYKDSILKGFFLIDASILAALVILWRRRRLKIESLKSELIKNNIDLIREEKIGLKLSKKNDNKKSKLFGKESISIKNGESITKLAKKLSISKGEVHLAAKMKMLAEN